MKREVYLTILYDYYSGLLTEKNCQYFENYYFLNLSLAEIAENLNVSRNAIHKQLKLIEDKLVEYESILKLYDKDLKIKEIIEEEKDPLLKKKLEELIM